MSIPSVTPGMRVVCVRPNTSPDREWMVGLGGTVESFTHGPRGTLVVVAWDAVPDQGEDTEWVEVMDIDDIARAPADVSDAMGDPLAAIRARLEAATPGPWVTDLPDEDNPEGVRVWAWGDHEDPVALIPPRGRRGGTEDADAQFIAHAQEDLTWALAEIERLREHIATHEMPPFSVGDRVAYTGELSWDWGEPLHDDPDAIGEVIQVDTIVSVRWPQFRSLSGGATPYAMYHLDPDDLEHEASIRAREPRPPHVPEPTDEY